MTARKVLKWLLVLVLLIGVAGGASAYWAWSRSDEILRGQILRKFAEFAPDCDVHIGRARFDWNRQVRLYEFSIKVANQQSTIVTIPQIVLTIDRETLTQEQRIVIHKIRVVDATVDLIRDATGRWNFQDFPPLPHSKQSCPEWEFEHATVRIQLQQPDGHAPGQITVNHADLKLIPSGKREYLIKGLTQVNHAGTLRLEGRWNIDKKTWTMNGQMQSVAAGDELVALAAEVSPKIRTTFAKIADTMRGETLRNTPRRPNVASNAIPSLGLRGMLDVSFNVSRWQPEKEPAFRILVGLRQGHANFAALPFPLHDIEGKVYGDNRRILIRDFSATNGITNFQFGGELLRQNERVQGTFDLKVRDLVLDERLRERLTPRLRKIYDSLNPRGQADAQLKLLFDSRNGWTTENLLLTAKKCSMAHVRFPYRVENINGTLRQLETRYEMDFRGQAGLRPVIAQGYFKNPGPESEVALDIDVEQLPLDDKFIAAAEPALRRTLQTLRLTGFADGRLRLIRPPGRNRKFQMQLSADVKRGSIEYEFFPYRLSNFSGSVAYTSTDKVWTFKNLKADHGNAKVVGAGSFSQKSAPGFLNLSIATGQVPLDRSLESALSDSLRKIWKDLSPSGIADAVVKIGWVPGRPAEISLPEIGISKGTMLLEAFPYRLEGVRANLEYTDDTILIKSFSAKHNQTNFRTQGFVHCPENADWRVRLVKMNADDLAVDADFRRALPEDLRDIIDELNLDGDVSLSGILEFRGTQRPQDPITSRWNIETVVTGNSLTAGMDLKNTHGRVTARGTWDGRSVNMVGDIDLDSVTVWGYQLTQVRGPFQIIDNQLAVGSRDALLRRTRKNAVRIPLEKRLSARAIGGVMTLDAAVLLEDRPSYHIAMTMSQGKLEEYVRRYVPGVKNVRGVMNGWIDLHGRGSSSKQTSGHGQLQISPAALYELPIMVQVFTALPFAPPNRTAFKYAAVDFLVANSQYRFNKIDLVGDALSLRGRGTARFDGKLDLDFYSMLPRQGQLPIPVIGDLIGQTTTGWVGVKVTGTVNRPQAKIRAVPALDAAMKRFLSAFEARPRNAPPPLLLEPQALPLFPRRSIRRR